jgi:hypothetical protein
MGTPSTRMPVFGTTTESSGSRKEGAEEGSPEMFDSPSARRYSPADFPPARRLMPLAWGSVGWFLERDRKERG